MILKLNQVNCVFLLGLQSFGRSGAQVQLGLDALALKHWFFLDNVCAHKYSLARLQQYNCTAGAKADACCPRSFQISQDGTG
ncbi:MAG: hypothetical protein KF823_02680 [Xanthomonadales bacterium]|nr:hypothetical protein [Xanthomonadales bacterium]